MSQRRSYLRDSELDRASYAEFREQVAAFAPEASAPGPRSYPGHPSVPLARNRPRPLVALEKTLWLRRCPRRLGTEFPSSRVLGRLLQFSHGVSGPEGRGPAPSAGGLQALELYLVAFEARWLPAGLYHYGREGHVLSRIRAGADREQWRALVPSLDLVEGGSLLWVLVGDQAKVSPKYGDRGGRFLLLEAGHLMQNLCLLSSSLGFSTVPLGGALEPEIAREAGLPAGDAVLYVGLCGSNK